MAKKSKGIIGIVELMEGRNILKNELEKETDRGAALVGSAFLETALV